jgi:hypothetical protein
MDSYQPTETKNTCQFRKANHEFCKRGVTGGEDKCWQHASGWLHKWKSLTRNQALGFILLLIFGIPSIPGLYFSYVSWRDAHAPNTPPVPAPEQEPSFALINILNAVVVETPSENVFWGLWQSQSNMHTQKLLTPIDRLFSMQVALRDRPSTLNFIEVEVRTTNGWRQMTRVPLDNIQLHAGPIDKAAPIALDYPDIVTYFNQNIPASTTLTGFAAYNFADRSQLIFDPNAHFRFTLTDSLGETITTEQASAGGQFTPGVRLKIIGAATNLKKYPQQLYH